MHKLVRKYCESVRSRHTKHFIEKDVLDCGSLDINGNNRYLFSECTYIGIDICEGKNVDIVTQVHKFKSPIQFDTVISTEMLEHDRNWLESLRNMFDLTKPGGMLLFTAAGTNRPEHGTTESTPQDSPMTHSYYKNITVEMIVKALDLDAFAWFEISYRQTDIRFAGIKR